MSLDDLAPVITLGVSENKKMNKVGNNGSQPHRKRLAELQRSVQGLIVLKHRSPTLF
jgi:hypothetical protein